MANTIKNRSPSEGSPSKGRKVSTTIVTPPKKVKKGKSKIAAKKQFGEKASSPSKWQLSSSSLSFSSLSLPASSSRPLSSLPSVQYYDIDWFNPEVICSECIKYSKNKDSLPNNMQVNCNSLSRNLNPHKLRFHSWMRLARLATQLPSYIIHCHRVKIRFYQVLLNWYCQPWCIHTQKRQCKFRCRHH